MTTESWCKQLKFDPLRQLLSSENRALKYFVKRDLLGQGVEPVENLWQLSQAVNIVRRQKEDGSWKYHGGTERIRSANNYDQLETYRVLGELVEKLGFARQHLTIRKAADFLFAFQTEEGDFRGIYGKQYSPNYSAAIMELLIKAGYGDDLRIGRGFAWLLSMRQDDGGWAIPIRTIGLNLESALKDPKPLLPGRSKPFSHLITGIVLRAFAAHPQYRESKEASVAGKLLASRFFEPDTYLDRKGADYWTKFSFPFWWTDLLSSIDSLYYLGFTAEDAKIRKVLEWFRNAQEDTGLWNLKLLRGKDKDLRLWVSFAICRVFKNYYE